MAWGWRGMGGWIGPWPGRGPFSYLPPWQRPCWIFGRGWCWRLPGYPWAYAAYFPWAPRWWAYPPYAFYGWGFWHPYWIPPY
ncbi:MAG: hypothetical protein QXK12_08820 [Candidatus Nezhaarchaeales archaeon]